MTDTGAMPTPQPFEILLVEDSPADARLTREALKDAKVWHNLYMVGDGVEAMDFLHRRGRFSDAPRPDLILLDLNLPRKDGREVLAEVKTNDAFKRIPVVVLTTSQADEDIEKVYNLNANCFISKPVDFEQFTKIVRSIEEFWFTVVSRLPK
ncbi:MAG TPA: response regulator [Burkholderiales bacterium]|nr:response regulator [Burkholderiales bacterium]